MNSMTQRVDPIALSKNPLSSHHNGTVHSSAEVSFRLFQLIIRLGHAWLMYYGAITAEAKNKAILQISLIEAERSRLSGMSIG